MNLSTQEISKGLAADQSDVQRAVFNEYQSQIIHLVRTELSSRFAGRIDPEDVASSAFRSFFVRARNGQYQLDEPNQVWKLLAKITLNKMRNQARHHNAAKRSVDRETSGIPTRLHSDELRPDEVAVIHDELERVLAELKPFHREIAERILLGQSNSEIATAAQRSLRTIRRVEATLEKTVIARFKDLQEDDARK